MCSICTRWRWSTDGKSVEVIDESLDWPAWWLLSFTPRWQEKKWLTPGIYCSNSIYYLLMIKLILGSKACELLSDIILNKIYRVISWSFHQVIWPVPWKATTVLLTTLLPSCWVFHMWGCIAGKQVQTNTCTHLKKPFSGYYWLQCISMRTLGNPKQSPNWEKKKWR